MLTCRAYVPAANEGLVLSCSSIRSWKSFAASAAASLVVSWPLSAEVLHVRPVSKHPGAESVGDWELMTGLQKKEEQRMEIKKSVFGIIE